MRTIRALALAALLLAVVLLNVGLLAGPAAADDGVPVVASIKPVHALVAAVMAGAGTPHLVIAGAASPHAYAVRPSDARALADARVVFWVGPQMETALVKPIAALAGDAEVVALADAPGVIALPLRAGGAFDGHAHDDADHDSGDPIGAIDMHLWLDPVNAKAMARAIEAALAEADPANRALYAANADALTAALDALVREVDAVLAPVRDRPFVVFHDAYRYFENRFGLAAAGAITVRPDIAPGARRVAEIRDRIGALGAVCVFTEPQFEPRVIAAVTEGTAARPGILDPLGAGLDPGPDAYFALIRDLAGALADCLSQSR